jgi:hypothetical protein
MKKNQKRFQYLINREMFKKLGLQINGKNFFIKYRELSKMDQIP